MTIEKQPQGQRQQQRQRQKQMRGFFAALRMTSFGGDDRLWWVMTGFGG
jgi:hypothetical protein